MKERKYDRSFPDEKTLRALWEAADGGLEDAAGREAAWQSVLVRTGLQKRRAWRRILRYTGVAATLLLPVLLGLFLYFSAPGLRPRPDNPMLVQCFVPHGEIRTVALPDGSSVCLNAGSVLIYPEEFSGGQRQVFLFGEGSFSVTKDAARPFVVGTADFEVEVLGTVFDVSSYPDEGKSVVVLSEGSVKVTGAGREVLLKEDQKLEYLRGSRAMTVSPVRAEDYLQWNDGGIYLQRATVPDILRILEKRYGVTAYCTRSDKYAAACITAKFQKQLPIEDFLAFLSSLIPGMKYEVDGTSVYLY